ncbi:hypothetical protein SBADM41S_07912 [Streptomyces badius]
MLELDDGRERFAYDVEVDPGPLGVLPGGALDAGDDGVEGGRASAARAEPAADEGGDGVDPVGLDRDLAERGECAGQFGLTAGGEHGLGVREHRVAAVDEPGGARVVGLAPEVEPPAAVRPDGGGDADGVAGQVEGAALLDVEFDERADPGEAFRVGADGPGVVSGRLHGSGQGGPVRVPQTVGVGDGELSGGEPGPDTGQAEAGALLVTEVGDGQRPGELHSPAVEFVERGEGGHHPERAVEGPAVRDGVQVGAGDDGVPGQGVAEPGPLVAVAVGLVREPARLGLRAEPGPAVEVGRRPGVAPVAAAVGVAPDGSQLPPHREEGVPGAPRLPSRGGRGGPGRTGRALPRGARGHQLPSVIGTRTPLSAATVSAMS